MPNRSIDPLPRVAPTPARPVAVNVRMLPANGHVATHAHDWAQLACTLRGAVRIRAGQTTWIVPPTRAVWIPPHVDHEVTLIGEVALRTIYVDASVAPRALDTCDVVDVSPLMQELIEALGESSAEERPVRHELLTRLLLEEMREAPALSLELRLPSDRRLRTLCDAMLEEPGAPFGLDEWAARTGASPRTLARLFQQELGMSFSQWRQRVRLAHAAALVAGGQSLASVAEALGYDSASAFSAMFKRALGQSPREFFGSRH
ncbi:MAG: helix-turn-helix domain-containing protein [Betaproteobacteria bacterium]|nr:helix-turn-helix domain-containing protein [Betaproteobacteria bacterium]